MVNHILNDTHNSSVNIYLRSDEAQEHIASNHKKFYLDELISVNPDTHLLIGLTNFDCPHSFYNVNGTNNKLFMDYADANNIPQEFNNLIPIGNYDIDSMLVYLRSIFVSTTLNVTFSSLTNKLSFTNSGRSFRFTSSKNTAQDILGYKTDTHATTHINNIVKLGGTNSLYFRIKNLGIRNLNSFGKSDGTIAKIDVKSMPNEFIYYETCENFYFQVENQILRSIEIEIVDDKHEKIDFNGGVFSCCLTLHFAFKRDIKYKQQYFLIKPEITEEPQKNIKD